MSRYLTCLTIRIDANEIAVGTSTCFILCISAWIIAIALVDQPVSASTCSIAIDDLCYAIVKIASAPTISLTIRHTRRLTRYTHDIVHARLGTICSRSRSAKGCTTLESLEVIIPGYAAHIVAEHVFSGTSQGDICVAAHIAPVHCAICRTCCARICTRVETVSVRCRRSACPVSSLKHRCNLALLYDP